MHSDQFKPKSYLKLIKKYIFSEGEQFPLNGKLLNVEVIWLFHKEQVKWRYMYALIETYESLWIFLSGQDTEIYNMHETTVNMGYIIIIEIIYLLNEMFHLTKAYIPFSFHLFRQRSQ